MTNVTRTSTTNSPTGVRDSSPVATDSQIPCCGGPAPTGTDGCCVRDADVKSAGGSGCGCASTPAAPAKKMSRCCA